MFIFHDKPAGYPATYTSRNFKHLESIWNLFIYMYLWKQIKNTVMFLKITLPEHFGMSHTAMEVGVQRGSHIAWLSSWWTFIASIHDPIVTSSLLNILKLKARKTSPKQKSNQTKQEQISKDKLLKETRNHQVSTVASRMKVDYKWSILCSPKYKVWSFF